MKNKFFTNESIRFANIVQRHKFAGVTSVEELCMKKLMEQIIKFGFVGILCFLIDFCDIDRTFPSFD